MRIRLVVEYDGTDFYGFQRQPKLRTVDQVLKEAIYRVTKEEVQVIGSGRTDAGVHALGQVVAFNTDTLIPPEKYRKAINTYLPPDIRVVRSEKATPDFHPRFDALSKMYRYLIYRSNEGYTFLRRYSYNYTKPLDLEVMHKVARHVRGEHDFRGFMASGSAVQNTVRQVYQFTIDENPPWMKIEITGNGFLYRMVRNMVGTLIEVGRGAMSFEQLVEVIRTGDRKIAGPTAPAQGLFLVKVDY